MKPYSNRFRKNVLASAVVVSLGMAVAPGALAFQFETDNPDLKVVWDNTVKYNSAWRLYDRDPELVSGVNSINQDDGDRNFKKGLISDRINLLSELDVTYRHFGARMSGAAWYDSVYNRNNDNDSPGTANQQSVPFNQFPNATRQLMGNHGELLDAFVFGQFDLGESRASFRAGRHTLIWGESLFYGSNGIAAGQAPVDVIKLLSVPGTTAKEAQLPVGQVSGQIEINPHVSVGAYYQYEWRRNRIPAAGSYFSTSDILDAGGERILLPTGATLFSRGNDLEASDSGQGGLQLRFRLPGGETDYGLYLIRYHDKSPKVYVYPPGGTGTYALVFPQNITAFGASFSRTIGDVNLAGEVSARNNMPLVSPTRTVLPGMQADNDNNPLYAVGNTLHAQMSALWTVPRTALFNEASFAGEIAWNRLSSITQNPQALDPNTTRDAIGFRFVFEPTYRQVIDGLDLGVPFGLGYTSGRSAVVASFGPDEGGDMSIGLNAAYLDGWRMTLTYTHYYGNEGKALDVKNFQSFQQALADRDYISFSVRRTF